MRGISVGLPAALMALAAPEQGEAREERLVLPSGLEAYLQESRVDQPETGLVVRFRFVAEAFTGDEDFEVQTADLEYLCNDFALSALELQGEVPHRVVISLSDQPSVFGQFDPDVTQIFESFSIENETCILELF